MTTAPQQEIRRFDIFAEWNRLKASKQLHLSAAESRAYGLAVAKVVAARKFSGAAPSQLKDWKRRAQTDDTAEPWWQHLGSDEEFRHKIVQRMGSDFYRTVFQRRWCINPVRDKRGRSTCFFIGPAARRAFRVGSCG